jgi:hypothetical protein
MSDTFPVNVLPAAEVERIYAEGVADYYAGKAFHETRYPTSFQAETLDDYQRGYEWRRGWNDGALGRALPGATRHSICNDCLDGLGLDDGDRARVISRMRLPCCWCSDENQDGNTISVDPERVPCGGRHGDGGDDEPREKLAA